MEFLDQFGAALEDYRLASDGDQEAVQDGGDFYVAYHGTHFHLHYQVCQLDSVVMLRLKDRHKQIPNGYRFYLPEVKWSAPGNYPSFDKVVQLLGQVIAANAYLAQKNKWPTDHAGVENWVDTYNATLCARMGWDDYIITDQAGSIPKSTAPHQSLQSLAAAAAMAKELVSGAKSLTEWIDSGEAPVSRDRAEARAAVCVDCPQNEKGDWTRWFTVPASELIKRQVEKAQARALSTVHDERLHLCTACHCPLKLKVHVPIDWITKRLTQATVAKLKAAPRCWIIQEMNNP